MPMSADLAPSKGYPALSTWMASDPDFFVLRRFRDLNARGALMMQDRIARLSEKLEKEDEEGRRLKQDNGTTEFVERER